MVVTIVEPARDTDRAALEKLFTAAWGQPWVVARGERRDLRSLPTLVARDTDGALLGVLTYAHCGDSFEIVSIQTSWPGKGVGSALLAAAINTARELGTPRIWLVTTNDNLDALRFYQRRGLRLTGLAPGAVEHSRLLKPEIPAIGEYGIPMRDELTLSLDLRS